MVQNECREMQAKIKGIVEMALRAQAGGFPYSCKNGARPKRVSRKLAKFLPHNYLVGLSARDGYVIGAVVYNSLSLWRMG
jgi:hypothetical protein